MADAIVSLIVERISDSLINEAVFLKDVKVQVQSINTELKRMQCFLEDVDRKPEQDNRLRNRVSEIRDLAYDAEDVIESFILKAAQQRDSGILKRFTSIFTKPFHLHKIGVEVNAIQTKIENLSRTLPAYEISGGVGSSSTSRAQQQLRKQFSHVEEDVVSLEISTKDVLARLMVEEDRSHAVVSIVGMGGIGKTTLARKVYNHVDVRKRFDCLAWVYISQQSNPREVFLCILMKVLSPSKDEKELIQKENHDELIKRLFHFLTGKRYLIVLDDIWKSEDWDILKPAFPRGVKGSKVLFTTRIKNVAIHADPCNTPMELPFLTDDESWNLLRRSTFPRNLTDSHAFSEEFEKLGREMAKQCGGLPLAIVVLGGLLARKQSLAQWEKIQRNIHGHLIGSRQQDQYGAIKGILELSYNDLPYHLKPCFLYLAHYPEDWEISKDELIRLWIAEGFISPSLESRETLLEEIGEQYLEELIDRSLVQVGKRDYTGTNVKTCHIHDLLRDLCVKKAKEESFLEIIHPRLMGNNADSVDVTLAESMLRRIAIHPSKRCVCLKGEHPKLRSLLLFQDEELIKMQISKCKSFKFLRVLKLVKKDVEMWCVSSKIGNLHHLRFLKLVGTWSIILPRSIGKLKSLYSLYVACEGFIVVPNVVYKLERLRHISLLNPPAFFGCLLTRFGSENIETLKHIKVGKEFNKAVLRLTNIQSLGLRFSRPEDVKGTLISLIKLHRLASLYIHIFDISDEISSEDLEPISQCSHLSKLKLLGEIKEDPRGRHHVLKFLPPSIVQLTLWLCKIKQDPMGVLEKLPCLRILKLDSYKGSKMICSANGFPQLDFLKFEDLDNLEEWEIEVSAMPRLRSLHLKQLSELKKLPEGLRYITTLQELKLSYMNSSLVERIEVKDDGREGEEFYKVRHIPSLVISNSF